MSKVSQVLSARTLTNVLLVVVAVVGWRLGTHVSRLSDAAERAEQAGYHHRLEDVNKQLDRAASAIESKKLAELPNEITRLREGIDRLADTAERVVPPREVNNAQSGGFLSALLNAAQNRAPAPVHGTPVQGASR